MFYFRFNFKTNLFTLNLKEVCSMNFLVSFCPDKIGSTLTMVFTCNTLYDFFVILNPPKKKENKNEFKVMQIFFVSIYFVAKHIFCIPIGFGFKLTSVKVGPHLSSSILRA